MQVVVEADLVKLSGLLNESSNVNDIEEALVRARLASSKNVVNVDFSGVTRANSAGIFLWCRLIRATKASINYVKAPVWLVLQFNYLDDFLEAGNTVESFYANFYCEDDSILEQKLLRVGKDIPVLTSYADYEFKYRSRRDAPLQPDFEPETYLVFLTKMSKTAP